MELSITQQNYPLSRRKFWKKITSHAILPGLLFLVVAVGAIIAMFAIGEANQSTRLLVGILLEGLLIFLALFFLLFLLPYGLYLHVYIQRYYYSLDENFITIRKGVFTPSEIHVQYLKIQDVYVDQDILDRIFGIFDVHIASATVSSGIEAHIDGLSPAHAEALKNELLEKIQHPSQQGPVSTSASAVSQANPEVVANLISGASSLNYPISSRWLISVVASTVWKIIAGTLFVGIYFLIEFYSESPSDVGLATQNEYSSVVYLIYAIIILLGALLRLGYSIWWRHNYYFELESEYIVLKQGVISNEERHIQYSSIQNVTLKQRLTDRIFGICDVVIENAASGGGGLTVSSKPGLSMGITGTNGLVIPGQMLAKGKELVEIVNKVTTEKNIGLNSKGL